MALSEGFPVERVSESSDDVARHGAKFVERKFCAARERVSNLNSPSGVRVRGGLVGFIRSGSGSIGIGLRVVVRREVKEVSGEGG